MIEILTKPTEPGLYWCRNVEGIPKADWVTPSSKRWWYETFSEDEDSISHHRPIDDPPLGEYIRIPEPVWPEPAKLPAMVLMQGSGVGRRAYWCVKVCKDTFSCISDDGKWHLIPFDNARITPHPANDPELEQKIKEVQG